MTSPAFAGCSPACLSSFVSELAPEGVFSADDVLNGRPDLWGEPPVVVELAYEEYCRRVRAGQSVVPQEFARRFKSVESSLLRLIEVEDWFDGALSAPGEDSDRVAFAPGDQTCGFELLEEIGEGAFARVFLARETRLSRLVVVKFGVRGAEEASTMAMLEHPNIAQVHSAHPDVVPGVTAICMPYRGRRTLQDWIAPNAERRRGAVRLVLRDDEGADPSVRTEGRLRPTELPFVDAVALMAADVLAALVHMHESGVVHGDIKPSNVLVGDDGVARLLDFNLSRADHDTRGRFGGTMPYMAPETLSSFYVRQSSPLTIESNGRTDLYSFGATLYHVLTGVSPLGVRHPGEGADAAAARFLDAPAPLPVRARNPAVDTVFADLIDACLARRPGDRPASAKLALRRLAARDAPRERLARWGRRHPALRNGAAAAILVVAGLGGWRLATAAPYPERQLHAGWNALDDLRYDDAVGHFTRAARQETLWEQAIFGRALANLAAERPTQALPDFEALYAARPTPEHAEGLAYCLAAGPRRFAAAIPLYESTLALQPRRASVVNNLGWCLLSSGRRDEAIARLAEAVSLDPRLQAPRYNLSIAELRKAMQRSVSDSTQSPPDLSHIEAALAIGPASTEVLMTAALTYAVASRASPEGSRLRLESVGYAKKALLLGIDPSRMEEVRHFLHGTPEATLVPAIASVKRTKAAPPHEANLLNPLVDGRLAHRSGSGDLPAVAGQLANSYAIHHP